MAVSAITDDSDQIDDSIAAIDFGTTSCSLAYKVKGSKVTTLKINDTFDRVPNAILIKNDPNGGILVDKIIFGFFAQKAYLDMPAKKSKDCLYFECFKMQLRNEENISRKMLISSFTGSTYYIIEVIALILQHLRIRFEEHLSMSQYRINDRKMQATDFHWVLTVPAIWKDRGKQMMREAAYKSGLIYGTESIEKFTNPPAPLPEVYIPSFAKERLVLALEPECAAFYCLQLNTDMLASHSDRYKSISSKQYMILDIGGGTVDIAIHEVLADKSINSVLPPTGNDCGGMKVNNEFSNLLQNMTEDKNFKEFCSVPNKEVLHKAVIANLIFQEFEMKKKFFGKNSNKHDSDICIRLDSRLVRYYYDKNKFKKMDGVELDEDDETIISISFSKMEQLFQPAIDGIISCMKSAMARSHVAIDTIYLVGGFGGCPYVCTKVKEALGRSDIQVIVPVDYNIAVAQGAVIFRQKMSAVNSRMSDAYYGMNTYMQFDSTKHPTERRYHNSDDDSYMVSDVFDIFVNKGQPVKFNEKFKKYFFPLKATHKKIGLQIYRTKKDGITFIKDIHGNLIPGVEELGELTVEAPINGLKLNERNIEVELILGGTELNVKAVYGPTGEEVNATFDFLKF